MRSEHEYGPGNVLYPMAPFVSLDQFVSLSGANQRSSGCVRAPARAREMPRGDLKQCWSREKTVRFDVKEKKIAHMSRRFSCFPKMLV